MKFSLRPTPLKLAQRGFSLLALLVAMIVSSFGILGLNESLLSSFDQSNDALSRSYAVLESKSLLQRVRSHQSSLGEFTEHYSNLVFHQSAQPVGSCLHRTCSASALADFDVALWQCALFGNDPNSEACATLRPIGLAAGEMHLRLPQARLALTINRRSGSTGSLLAQIRWQGPGLHEQMLNFGVR
jgi:Tfp pilus assembly protein PilV